MSRYFISKVERLRNSIPNNNIDPLTILKETMSQKTSSFSFRPVKPDEVLEIIKQLKNSKYTGSS